MKNEDTEYLENLVDYLLKHHYIESEEIAKGLKMDLKDFIKRFLKGSK